MQCFDTLFENIAVSHLVLALQLSRSLSESRPPCQSLPPLFPALSQFSATILPSAHTVKNKLVAGGDTARFATV